jgi:hypothetical protein
MYEKLKYLTEFYSERYPIVETEIVIETVETFGDSKETHNFLEFISTLPETNNSSFSELLKQYNKSPTREAKDLGAWLNGKDFRPSQ